MAPVDIVACQHFAYISNNRISLGAKTTQQMARGKRPLVHPAGVGNCG
jgi:hypothetical protein